MSYSSIDMESSSDYMNGGMITSKVDWWSSRVFRKDADPSSMGRWSYQTLVGKKNSKLTIITGYRWVRNDSGNNSIWMQEKIHMRERQAKSSPHPRKQFIKDLIAFIYAKQTMNHEINVNLDAKEFLGEESQGMAKLMMECDLVDLLDKPELDPDYTLM
jgi:hypothetical protein